MTQPAEILFNTERWHELSREINYVLMASPLNKLALLNLILGRPIQPELKQPLLEAVEFLLLGYGEEKRKLGTPAVLHPLRTGAILARNMPELRILDLLGAFLHDRDEDLSRDSLEPQRWGALQRRLEQLLATIDRDQQWYLGERIAVLSKNPSQSYFDYINKILDHALVMPDLIRIKLADKLDSTYDIQIPLSSFERTDFHRTLFEILFVPTYPGVTASEGYSLVGEREGVLLLSSIGKNALFLSLLRRTGLDRLDSTTDSLFRAVAHATIRQARWVLLEVFATKITDVKEQRLILKEVLAYRESGGLVAVTASSRGHRLDGTLLERFVFDHDSERKRRLAELYCDHALFARVVLTMIVVFHCFLDDPQFTIKGIERSGIKPVG